MADMRWYHGRSSRQKAEDLLWKAGKNGSFVVRESETIHGAYALSVLHQSRIHTYRVLPTKSGQLGVQTKDGVQDRTFITISQLVNTYKSSDNGLVCGLTNPVGPSGVNGTPEPATPSCPTISEIAGPPLPKRNIPQQVTAVSTRVLPLTQSLHPIKAQAPQPPLPPPPPPPREPVKVEQNGSMISDDISQQIGGLAKSLRPMTSPRGAHDNASVKSMIVKFQHTGVLKFPVPQVPNQNIKRVGEAPSSTTETITGATDDTDQHRCVICLDSTVNTFFAPCGHVCCCFVCAKSLKNCPLCRKKIEARHKAYLA